MKTLPRVAVAFATAGLAGVLFAEMHGSAIATPAASPQPALVQGTVAQSIAPVAAPPLVNLPDFSRLVEKAGPAVVNIEATIGKGRAAAAQDFGGGDGDDDGQDASPE
jgi:serine protease Do